jgi:hypothetical protein
LVHVTLCRPIPTARAWVVDVEVDDAFAVVVVELE